MSVPTTSDPQKSPSYLSALTVYLRPSVLVILLLGFSSGLPLALSGETLRVWMADSGVDLGTIGLLSLAGLPYTLKFIWAPVVDAWQVPGLSRRFGRRRAWLIASQLVLMAAIVFLGTRDPVNAPWMIGLGALIVAFASATQDIVVDAYRVQSLPVDEQAAGMAGYVAAYRIGMLASGAGVIGFSAWLEAQGVSKEAVWPLAYAAAALLVLVGLVAALLAREPKSDLHESPQAGSPMLRLFDTAKGAFTEFLSRDAALGILLFVVMFKLCDALAGTMTAPFVLSLGYSKATYAAIVKGVGLAALLIGGFAGGAIARAMPLASALWLAAFLQMFSNLAFIWLGYQTPSAEALTVAIIVENFSGAIGTVIFVAYLSALCRNPLHTATQYALLTALASTGRTLFSSGTGFAAQELGWPLFFLGTSLTAIPALMLMLWLQGRGHFRALDADRNGS
ncbi:MAG TPA: MFS transporter [Hyphomicrobium sp.]|jgi:PAT family beta-lactamase induction signal transducer AmpG